MGVIFSHYVSKNEAAFLTSKHHSLSSIQKQHNILFSIPKGGASRRKLASKIEEDTDDDDEEIEETESEYESESEEESEEEEEEEEVATTTLLKSTKASTAKIQKKHKQESKSTVNVVLQKEKLKRKYKKNIFPKIRLPYLLRACLSPYTLYSMTKAYFASLVNVSYLEEMKPQKSLRPTFEEKVTTTKPKKGKRIMKPGQAKTLSDLPKLG